MESDPKVIMAIIPNEDNDKVLVIDRVVHALGVSWAFPGGVREQGETIEDCAIREAQEEVGIDVEAVGELSRRKHPNTKVPMAYVECRMKDPNQKPQILQPQEIQEIRWVSGKEALELFTSDVDPIIRKYLESM